MGKIVSTRERILRAARTLFQRRGYFAVGTAEILAMARAPKGSMYHHFPGGKEAIAIAAVEEISRDTVSKIQRLHERNLSVADLIRELAHSMENWLKASRWREGALLSSMAIGAVPDLPHLHAAICKAFNLWREQLTGLLILENWPITEACEMTELTVASLEGALIVARNDQDSRALRSVADSLSRLLDNGPIGNRSQARRARQA